MKENLLMGLLEIPKQVFKNFFKKWKKDWEWYISSDGEYSEGDRHN
jgi:hypothetical protein